MHNKVFISADCEAKNFGRKSEKSAKFFCLKISRNENFVMQMAYGDKRLFNKFFWFIIAKFDFLVKIPLIKEVLWNFFFGYVWKIFSLPFLNTLGYTLFKKYCFFHRHFRLELLPFRRGVNGYLWIPNYWKLDEYKYGKMKLFDNKSEKFFRWHIIFANKNN